MKQHIYRLYIDTEYSTESQIALAFKVYKGETLWAFKDRLEAEAEAKEIVYNTNCVVSLFELNRQNSLIDELKGVPHRYFWKSNGKIKYGAYNDCRLLWRKAGSS